MGTHRGEEVSTNPDQNVTGRPSALLPELLPRRQALNVTAHRFTKSAREKIEKAGGAATEIGKTETVK